MVTPASTCSADAFCWRHDPRKVRESLKFGQAFANQIRRRLPAAGDKWHLDEVVLTIAGVKHGL